MSAEDSHSPQHLFRWNSRGEVFGAASVPEVIQKAVKLMMEKRGPLRLDESSDLLLAEAAGPDSVQSFLGAPIVSSSGGSGWFYLVNKRGADEFSEADERLAATLATHVAVAYQNAILYAETRNHATELQMEMAIRKQAEEERARLLVREQAARAEAETANRNKDEFLATLSHELRTPLTAILGWSHLMRSKKLNEEEVSRALDTIERNARSQSQLIDDLLDVSRIITGKLQIEYGRVELSSAVTAAYDSIRPAAEAKTIGFAIGVEATPCFVSGDSHRLQQIFWNLFSNAVKFTPKGGQVNVTVRADDSSALVSVADTGIGINPDFVPFIFDRFRQADGSTTREHGGLGLGLAIVRHLVDLHTGTVSVESLGKDRGATFTVMIPLADTDVVLAEDNGNTLLFESSDLAGLAASTILNGIKVLVVDDEPDSRDLLMAILTRCGSDVRCSESVAAAMQTFDEWDPDLLVSDIGMPNEDGYSLIRKLRKLNSSSSRIPAVALTAYATDEDRSLALSAGFQMHVAKPIEPESFVTSIASVMGRNRPER